MTLEFRKVVGSRLKEARKQAGFTCQRAAEAIGVVRQAVVSWESGKSYPTPAHLKDIASLYGVSTDWLLEQPYAVSPMGAFGSRQLRDCPAPYHGAHGRGEACPFSHPDPKVRFTEFLRAACQELSPDDLNTVLDMLAFLLDRNRKTVSKASSAGDPQATTPSPLGGGIS